MESMIELQETMKFAEACWKKRSTETIENNDQSHNSQFVVDFISKALDLVIFFQVQIQRKT